MTEKDDGRLIKSHHPTAQLMPGPPALLSCFPRDDLPLMFDRRRDMNKSVAGNYPSVHASLKKAWLYLKEL